MRLEVTTETRVGITKDVLDVVARHQFLLRGVEVVWHHIFLDIPWSFMYMLTVARLFARPDGYTPLVGLNVSNSVNADTIRACSAIREALGMTDRVRIEHHITETYKHIVRQPYLRRDELLDIARDVPNVSAKHEGSEPEIEEKRAHPSDCLEYFRTKEDLETSGEMALCQLNYLDKHESINRTARALTEQGLSFVAARNLHRA